MLVWGEGSAIQQPLLLEVRQAETFLYMQEMNPETLEALKMSIAHWERLASGKRQEGEEVSVWQCALCAVFQIPIESNDQKCVGCPVFEKTMQQFCRGTPFVTAEALADSPDPDDEANRDYLDSEEFQDAAQKELEFLKSLLPKETIKEEEML